jgi:hypothetical protein
VHQAPPSFGSANPACRAATSGTFTLAIDHNNDGYLCDYDL